MTGLLAIIASMRGSRTPPRPENFHPDAPWPIENEWARNKVMEAIDGVGQRIWTDDSCGEMCVIEHNAGGEQRRRKNPDCPIHAIKPEGSEPEYTYTIKFRPSEYREVAE